MYDDYFFTRTALGTVLIGLLMALAISVPSGFAETTNGSSGSVEAAQSASSDTSSGDARQDGSSSSSDTKADSSKSSEDTTWGGAEAGARYLSDDTGYIKDDVKLTLAEANGRLKKAGWDYRIALVVRRGQVADGSVDAYATRLFNELGVGDGSSNQGIMVLLMPDARQYALKYGDDAAWGVRDALSDDIFGSDPSVYGKLKDGDWDAAADAMVRATYAAIKPVINDSVTRYQEPEMSEEDQKAMEGFAKAVGIGIVGVVLVGGAAAAIVFGGSHVVDAHYRRKAHRDRDEALKRVTGSSLAANAGITAADVGKILSNYSGEPDGAMRYAVSQYVRHYLPAAMAKRDPSRTVDEYEAWAASMSEAQRAALADADGYVKLSDALERAGTWFEDTKESDVGDVVKRIGKRRRKEAEVRCETRFDAEYAAMRAEHGDALKGVDEKRFKKALRKQPEYSSTRASYDDERDWAWMWLMLQSAHGAYDRPRDTWPAPTPGYPVGDDYARRYGNGSDHARPSHRDDDDDDSGFGGGHSSGGGFSGGFDFGSDFGGGFDGGSSSGGGFSGGF